MASTRIKQVIHVCLSRVCRCKFLKGKWAASRWLSSGIEMSKRKLHHRCHYGAAIEWFRRRQRYDIRRILESRRSRGGNEGVRRRVGMRTYLRFTPLLSTYLPLHYFQILSYRAQVIHKNQILFPNFLMIFYFDLALTNVLPEGSIFKSKSEVACCRRY